MPQLPNAFAFLPQNRKFMDLDRATGQLDPYDDKCPLVAQKILFLSLDSV